MKHRNFSLALGGGSARGFAHIGVLEYLEENGYYPSYISGTSMGAIIGSLFALGFSPREIRNICAGVGIFSMLDFTADAGILSIKKVEKYLEKFLGDKAFSDAKIPLSIIATNLNTGKKQVFSDGKILNTVCASIAIPGIFRPYKIGKERFIDGGMCENLPLSPCSNLPILASSVISVSGVDFQKIPFLQKRIAVVEEAISIMLAEQENAHLQNMKGQKEICLIRTKEQTTGYMDFSHLDTMIQAGRKSAQNARISTFLQK